MAKYFNVIICVMQLLYLCIKVEYILYCSALCKRTLCLRDGRCATLQKASATSWIITPKLQHSRILEAGRLRGEYIGLHSWMGPAKGLIYRRVGPAKGLIYRRVGPAKGLIYRTTLREWGRLRGEYIREWGRLRGEYIGLHSESGAG